MKKLSVFRQTFFLTFSNGIVRCIGFGIRILLSRMLGAEAMGILELASSAHMLWLSPVTSGLPLAISRETAAGRGKEALSSGLRLALKISLPLMGLLFFLLPLISHLLGDVRTLPSLLFYLFCLPVLSVSAVCNGACYGSGNTLPPSASEILEQALRLLLCVFLLSAFPALSTAWAAAVSPLAILLGEIAGLFLVFGFLRRDGALPKFSDASKEMEKNLLRLSLPLTGMRLTSTLMRSVTAILTPLRLQAFGLSPQEATARLGMLTGMAMPLIMLPGILTGALSMVATPAIARRESQKSPIVPAIALLLLFALLIGFLSSLFIYLFAPYFARHLYRTPDLTVLLRVLCPMSLLFALHQIINGIMSGLGQQKSALTSSLASALLEITLLYFLTAQSGLLGCIAAQLIAHAFGVVFNFLTLVRLLYQRRRLTPQQGTLPVFQSGPPD